MRPIRGLAPWCLFLTFFVSGQLGAQPERPLYVPGEVLVRVAAPQSIQSVAARVNARILRRFQLPNTYHLRLAEGSSVPAALQALRGRADVIYASPNYYRYLDAFPSDPRFDEMWGLHNSGQTGGTPDADIDAPEAWDITTGSDQVVIAVIDSGADLSHPDLANNLWINPGEDLNGNGQIDAGEANGIDDDGNGFIDDFFGWDFADNDNFPSPAGGGCVGHGTHTAGTVGAVGDNGVGVTGVSQNVKLMILKVFRPTLLIFCSASDADLLDAIDYSTRMGVRISNNSWGGGGFNAIMRDTIRATRALFVAAAGNSGQNSDVSPQYPAAYDLDNIVSVAATDHNDQLASFSNFGATTVDLGAPGVDILSTLPGGYGQLSGTSMASPHAAGVAGLLLAQDPSYTVNELKDRLLRGVDVVAGLSGSVSTDGRLNAFGSLTAPNPLVTGVTASVAITGSTTVPRGGTVDAFASITNNTASSLSVTVKLFAQVPSGATKTLFGPATPTLSAGQTAGRAFSLDVPSNAPLGTYFLILQVSNPDSLDEDLVTFDIVP